MSIKQEPDTLREDMADFNNARDIKIDNGENIPWVKTEDSSIEEISEFPISSNSQEDWVKQEVSTLDISSGQDYCCNINKSDLLQEKETSATPYNLNSSYTYITDTSLQYSKEFSQHKTHMTVKSELNMSNDSSSDTKVHVTGNIQEFCKYLPSTSSDDVFPKQEEQVKVYKCGTCAYSSNSLFQMYQHYTLHEMDTVYICDLCQSLYQYFNDLKCHLASHINDGENSDELFYGRKENLIEYDKTSKNVEHVSQDVYPQNNDQNVKLKLLCTDHYKCSYTMEGELKCQNVLHKGDENSFLNMSKNQSEKLRDSSSGEYSHKYSCDLCNYSCRNLSRLKQHLYKHSGEKPYSCDMCRYSSSNAHDLKRHKRCHTGEKPYSCDMCSYSSSNARDLKTHKRRHTGEKPYSCDLCSFSSASASGITTHKICHRNELPYSCDMCYYSSRSASDLKRHKTCHTGEKPYLSYVEHVSQDVYHQNNGQNIKLKLLCTDYYKMEGELKCQNVSHKGDENSFLNMSKHPSEKLRDSSSGEYSHAHRYSCDLCNYSCRYLSRLKQHLYTHSGEKPYSCDLCSYTCTCPSMLKRHKKFHTGEKPYSCDMCNYSSAIERNLKIHKRCHTGEKPYTCDMCSYKCANTSDLKKHKKCHTGEKPLYSCDLCSYTCVRASGITKHKRCHTNELPY